MTISSSIIIIISIIYLNKMYNVTFGDYAQSWNNCSALGGYREATDALKKVYKKYDKTITLHNMFTDFVITYLDFNPNHKHNSLDVCLNPKGESSLSKLFEKYTKDNGKVFIILQHDKEELSKLLEYYPKIELELIEDLKLPKVRSFVGSRLTLYLIKKI